MARTQTVRSVTELKLQAAIVAAVEAKIERVKAATK